MRCNYCGIRHNSEDIFCTDCRNAHEGRQCEARPGTCGVCDYVHAEELPYWKNQDSDGLVTMAVQYRAIARTYGDYVTYAEALDVAYRLTATPYPAGIDAS
jgi:hypothetical protein